jgi:COMPASS component BRE2
VIPFPSPTPPVHISWLDRSHFLRLSADALTATTDRGFRSGRANLSVREGTWYFEAAVLRGNGQSGASKGSGGDTGNAHVRVGWGRREAGLDAPVGADGYGYGFRDVGAERVHVSRSGRSAPIDGRESQGFGTGDVVGCLISLPRSRRTRHEPEPRADQLGDKAMRNDYSIVNRHRRRVSIRYKAQNYFEMEEYPLRKEMEALVDRDGKYAQAKADAAAADALAEANGLYGKGEKSEPGLGAKPKRSK